MLTTLLLAATLAAPALVVETPSDLPVALRSWEAALRDTGLATRPTPDLLLQDDHPLLPNRVELAFSGTAVFGFREGRVNGTLVVERVAPGLSKVSVEFTPGPTPRDEAIQPRLLTALQREAADFPAADTAPIGDDARLLDPASCPERVGAFASSPFAGAEGVIVAHLDRLPSSCRRTAVTALVRTPEGKAAVTAWLLRAYEATPDAERAALLPLAFQIADPSPEIEALIAREEARQDAGP